MKISIIIPCYNVQDYIEQCLGSIISQTYINLEIICINDGSTDKTVEILQQFETKDSRIKLYNQSNKGLSKTRSLGIEYATGDYILFVDSDDWLEKDALEIILREASNYDIILFSYFRDFKNVTLAKRLNLDGEFLASELQRKIVGPVGEEIKLIENLDSLVTVWAKLYKSEKIKNITFPEVSEIGTWEDGLFNLQVLENCNKVLIIDQPFYHYRKDNLQSFTSKSKENLYQKWLVKFEMINRLIKSKESTFHMALQNRIAISILGLALTELGSNRSSWNQIQNLKTILSEPTYKKALQGFNLDYLPLQWKLFYNLAKKQYAVGLYALTLAIRIVQKLKNL